MRECIVSCEHGGNRIPARYRVLFAGWESLLDSHRGYDLGALALARVLAARIGAPLRYSTISRLLVDLNRSAHHRQVFSEVTRSLQPAVRMRILQRFHTGYRNRVIREVQRLLRRGDPALHVSVHSFAPVLGGKTRNAGIGLLYDPGRATETAFCIAAKAAFIERGYRARLNYPYRGNADGFTTFLRERFGAGYSGIELEANQALIGTRDWPARRRDIVDVVSGVVGLWRADLLD